jgi:hypothetical protein
MTKAGVYVGFVHVASKNAGWFKWGVAGGLIVWPYAVATCIHPQDALKLQYRLQGLPWPHSFTSQQLFVGFCEAAFALAVLALLQLVFTVLFYREAKIDGFDEAATPTLWPVALFVGILGNAAWFYGTAAWDTGGCVIGLSSTALTVGAEMIINKLGREFVFGSPAAAQARRAELFQFPANGA